MQTQPSLRIHGKEMEVLTREVYMKRKDKFLLSALSFLVIVLSACNFQISQLATISQVDNVTIENSEELPGRNIELEIGDFLSDFRG